MTAYRDRRIGIDRRVTDQQWLAEVDKRAGERRFEDTESATGDVDLELPYRPCQWADVPTTGFL